MEVPLVEYSFDKLYDIGKKIYNNITSKHEFEVMFYNFNKSKMSYEQYILMINYIKNFKDKASEYSLDITYSDKYQLSYRITINNIENINEYMKFLSSKPNYLIIKTLVILYKSNKINVSFMKKIRDTKNIVNVNDLDIRFRLLIEDKLSDEEIDNLTKLTAIDNEKITFRYKQRISGYIEKDDKHYIRIDLTNVKMGQDINKIITFSNRYELEIELNSLETNYKYLKTLIKSTEDILRVLQKSSLIITKSEVSFVLNNYERILSIKRKGIALEGRSVVSLDINNMLDILPNKYAVTDKADGERCFLIIIDGYVYLIDNNLKVIKLGIKVSDKYNDTILDGELININDKQLFMVFDCLFNGKENIMNEKKIELRLEQADRIINECFVNKKQKGYKFKKPVGDLSKFHDKEINIFLETLISDFKNSEQILIRRKYFIFVSGKQDNEIFKYSIIIWNKYVKEGKCPYVLDGLIYHPLIQEYTTHRSVLSELKWKPPEKNSIDFYIKIEKDKLTNKDLIVYDNTLKSKNKPYKICKLYCGMVKGTVEEPVEFLDEKVYIFLTGNNIKTLNDEVIPDGGVVECYYNNDITLDSNFRWVPIRLRYDKMESISNHGRKYGNNMNIAKKILDIIQNPILIDDIDILSHDNMYLKHVKFLKSKIKKVEDKPKDSYYQIVTEIGKPMKNFHNWIKNNIIQTYLTGGNYSILDLACGQGGDIMKFYYSKISNYVGIDIDANTLLVSDHGALSRYNIERRKRRDFPKMVFINADVGVPLDYENQIKSIGKMNEMNKKLMLSIFPTDNYTKFDRINCQFAIHYLLKDQLVWDNFKNNINLTLKEDGYLFITTFDGDKVANVLDKTGKFTLHYVDEYGNKTILIDIIKKYDKYNKRVGNAIDVYNSLIFEKDTYVTEYLVNPSFLISEFKTIDLELVDTDLFESLFNNYREFFLNVINHEKDTHTLNRLKNVASFYDQTKEINKQCFEITKLNRYYVFHKRKSAVHVDKKKMKGGYRDLEGGTYKDILFKMLKEEKYIPDITKEEFVIDFGLLNIDDIEQINKKIVIEHEIEKRKEKVIDGLETIVYEIDCDDEKEKTIYGGGSKYVMMLYDDNNYYGIYKKEGDNVRWIFNK